MEKWKLISIVSCIKKAKIRKLLPPNIVDIVVSEICFDETTSVAIKHVGAFSRRQYFSMPEMRKALLRGKFLGDLGNGG